MNTNTPSSSLGAATPIPSGPQADRGGRGVVAGRGSRSGASGPPGGGAAVTNC